jgi:hypothetical protein
MDGKSAGPVGTALIVSEDSVVTRQLAEAMQELAYQSKCGLSPQAR